MDDECKQAYKCLNIIGLVHFGKQIRYCCPTKSSDRFIHLIFIHIFSASICTTKPKREVLFGGRRKCTPVKTAFYFDIDRLKCTKNRIAQCEEFGENRFASEMECRTKCETTGWFSSVRFLIDLNSVLFERVSLENQFFCTMKASTILTSARRMMPVQLGIIVVRTKFSDGKCAVDSLISVNIIWLNRLDRVNYIINL